MSDPLEPLRSLQAGGAEPDLAAIQTRARRIRSRRMAALSGAAALAVAAAAGVIATRGPQQPRSFAVREARPTSAPSPVTGEATTPESPSSEDTLAAPAPSPTPLGRTGTGVRRTTGTTPAPAAAAGKVSDGESALQLSLSVQPEQFKPGEQTVFKLQACNTSSREAVVAFRDAQRFDFEVTREGRHVWRWSSEQLFAQVTGTESWQPGQCREYTAKWNGSDYRGTPTTGSHDVIGMISTVPPRKSGPKRVCVVTCY